MLLVLYLYLYFILAKFYITPNEFIFMVTMYLILILVIEGFYNVYIKIQMFNSENKKCTVFVQAIFYQPSSLSCCDFVMAVTVCSILGSIDVSPDSPLALTASSPGMSKCSFFPSIGWYTVPYLLWPSLP